jgi:hypothetical protein
LKSNGADRHSWRTKRILVIPPGSGTFSSQTLSLNNSPVVKTAMGRMFEGEFIGRYRKILACDVRGHGCLSSIHQYRTGLIVGDLG